MVGYGCFVGQALVTKRAVGNARAAISMKAERADAPVTLSRRAAIGSMAAAVAAFGAESALAVVPPQGLGGIVEQYKDIAKGFTIFRPSGWNEFTVSPGNYDIKWQDIIQPLEAVTVLTTPVSKGKTIQDLGAPEELGAKVAASRNAELISASEKDVDGTVIYQFEVASKSTHYVIALTITKSKLYSVNASCSESRWSKREKLLKGVVDSFKPSLS